MTRDTLQILYTEETANKLQFQFGIDTHGYFWIRKIAENQVAFENTFVRSRIEIQQAQLGCL
jgi:hypothetical protein